MDKSKFSNIKQNEIYKHRFINDTYSHLSSYSRLKSNEKTSAKIFSESFFQTINLLRLFKM